MGVWNGKVTLDWGNSRIVKGRFTPNWKRLGFDSKEEGAMYTIKCLFENGKKILSKGLSGEAVFTYKNKTFRVKGKRVAKRKG